MEMKCTHYEKVLFSHFLQKSRTVLSLLCMLFFATIVTHAQRVNWTSGYPKFNKEPIVILGEERTLFIRFTPLDADISNAAIDIKLPPQIEAGSASSKIVIGGTSLTLSEMSSGTLATGKTLTITITSTDNKLSENQEVEFQVKINALCAPNGIGEFDIQVKSGSANVTDGNKKMKSNIKRPVPALVPQSSIIAYSSASEVKTITYYLKVNTAEKAKSAKVFFMTDLQTRLEEFKLRGTSINATETTSGGSKTYETVLTPTLLGALIDQTNHQTITFKASSMGGSGGGGASHTISSKVQYPHDQNCFTTNGGQVTMAYSGMSAPKMDHIETTYIDGGGTPIEPHRINLDGTTPTEARLIFQNTGGSNATGIKLEVEPYGQYAYFDIEQIYEQVEGGPKNRVDPSYIEVERRIINNPRLRYLKPGLHNVKPLRIHIKTPATVPPGKKITYWIPTINGDIYDNTDKNVFFNYATYTINGLRHHLYEVKDPNERQGIVPKKESYHIRYMNASHWREIPAMLGIKTGAANKCIRSVAIAPGTIHTSNQIIPEFQIQTPAWLKINDIKITTDLAGDSIYNDPRVQITKTMTHPAYTLTFNTSPGVEQNLRLLYLHIEYEGDPSGCIGGNNATGTVKYIVNQTWPSKKLEKLSQVFQQVMLLCALDGISLNEFSLQRTTKGLKDSDNDEVPDDGSSVSDSDIRNDLYVEGDKGFFIWKGTIHTSGYKYLDIPVTMVGFRNKNLIIGNGTISINNGPSQAGVTYTSKGDATSEGYFRYHAPGGLLAGPVEIRVPFEVKSGEYNGMDDYNSIETELYVSNTPITDPNNSASDPARHGKDKNGISIGLYRMDPLNWWYHDGKSHTFSTNDPLFFGPSHLAPASAQVLNNISLGYVDIFHQGKFPAPHFSKEVRFHAYLEQLEWQLPRGYRITSPLTIYRQDRWDERINYNDNSKLIKNIVSDPSSTKERVIHKIADIYDLAFDGSVSLAPNKIQRPDDYWFLRLFGTMKA